MLVAESLVRSAATHPGHTAVYFRDQKITYAGLLETASRLASRFADLGVAPGDRVALLLDNCPEFVYGYYAVLLAGGVVVPTNTFLVNPEIDYIYRDAEVSLLITSDRFAARLQPIFKNLPGLRGVIAAATEGETAAETAQQDVRILDFASVVAEERPDFALRQQESPGKLAVLQYTSGTTGKPKGVMLSNDNLITNARAVSVATQVNPDDRFLLALPSFHSFSQMVCVVTSVLNGTSLCIIPKIDRAELVFSLMNHRPTVFPGVPALFHMMSLAPAPPPEMNPVRLYISGGAPLPRPVQQRFEENYKKPIYEGYGLTEASPVVSWNLPGRNRPGSVGKPIQGVEVCVSDETGRRLPPGEVGELCVKAGSVMIGYYKAEQETAAAIVDGWLRTGDMAKIDADGYIYIVERKKELILYKGLNVYPSEIESVLMQRSEIAEVAVVGAPEGAHGEVPEAFIVFHPGQAIPENELKSFCRENLAAYKVPRKFHVAAQLPKTPTGKIKKAELRAALEARIRNASA